MKLQGTWLQNEYVTTEIILAFIYLCVDLRQELYSPVLPQTYYLDKAVLKLPAVSTFPELGLLACVTVPGFSVFLTGWERIFTGICILVKTACFP